MTPGPPVDLDPDPRLPGALASATDAVALVVCCATVVVLALAPVSEVDLFWHLAVGRHIAQTGWLPTTNLWSFTAPNHPFDATAWLFDWVVYRLHATWGLAAVQVATAGVIAAAFALVYLTARKLGASASWALCLTLAGAAASQTRFTQRPHVVSFLGLAAIGLLFSHARSSRRSWLLAAAPLLVGVWSNFHAGAVFGAGACAIGALASWLGLWRRKTESLVLSPLAWTATAIASVVALGANPNGYKELSYALFHLRSVNDVVPLGEFGSPGFGTHAAFWLLLAVGAGAFVLRGRHTDAHGALAFLAFGALAGRAMYVAPLFVIIAVPSTAANLGEMAAPLTARLSRLLRVVASALGPPAVLVAALSIAPEPLVHFVSRVQLGADPFRIPERGAAAVTALGISGRCFASWDVSGFTEWALPESPVFMDPRLLAYPPELYTELASAEESQEGFDALMDRFGVEWSFRSHRVLRMSGIGRFPPSRWALVYWDESSLILLRRDLPKFEALIRNHEIRYFLPASSPLESWRTLKSTEHDVWAREVSLAAEQSPLLANAQLGRCLEASGTGNLEAAMTACNAAVSATLERERLHPLEGQQRRKELAIGLVIFGQSLGRAGNAGARDEQLAQAEKLVPDNPEVLTAIGGAYLRDEPKKALGFFTRALEINPDFPLALRGRESAQRRP